MAAADHGAGDQPGRGGGTGAVVCTPSAGASRCSTASSRAAAQIEDRQLGTADRLEACLAIDAVVAWRIHHLTWLGRATPDLPCTVAFDDDQWKAVIVFKTRKPPPEQPPSLRQMIRSIAQLGGFLARKSNRKPGSQTLWRGLQRMDDITAAFRSFTTAYAMPP